MKIGIVVVAFNAESTLESVIKRVPHSFVSQLHTIIICDDASSDATFERAQYCKDNYPHLPIHIQRHSVNRGYGGNQKSGYALAKHLELDVVVLLHADAQYAPELLPDIVAPISSGKADAVFGSRMMIKGAALKGGMPAYKFVGNRILTTWQNYFANANLSEWHSGYRAYSVAALNAIPFESNSDGFDFDTQIILQLLASEARIAEVPIPTYYGNEISHVNGIKYGFQVMLETARYRFNKAGYGSSRHMQKTKTYTLKSGTSSSHRVILKKFTGKPSLNVLDLGSSDGLLGSQIEALGHSVLGVDIAPSSGNRTNQIRADLNDGIPIAALPKAPFDVILCADVLEHLQNPENVLSDCRNQLAPGGTVLVSTPNFGHWYPRFRVFFGLFDYDIKGILDRTHLRFYTKRSFQRMSESCGYTLSPAKFTGIPVEQLLQSRTHLASFLILIYPQIEKLFIRLRPQIFAYQFVYELTPTEGKGLSSNPATTSQK